MSGAPQISDGEAVRIAREAVRGHINLAPDMLPGVQRSGDEVIVTFAAPPDPAALGPDHAARVTLDAATGAVREILGGS